MSNKMMGALLALQGAVAVLLVPVALEAWGDRTRRQETDRAVAQRVTLAEKALADERYAEAQAAFEAAVTLSPTDPALQGRILAARILRAAASPDVPAKEVPGVQLALSTTGDTSASASVVRGHLAAQDGDSEEARRWYQKAQQQAPDFVHAFLAQARLEEAAGKSLEALAAYEQAVAVAPKHVASLNDLGVLYLSLGRNEDALAMFQRALTARDNAASRLNAASALAGLKRMPEALENLRRASALTPRSAEVWRRLGAALVGSGDAKAAETALVTSLRLEKRADVLFQLGRIYHGQKRYERAVELYREVLKAAPELLPVGFELARTLLETGQLQAGGDALTAYLRRAADVPAEAKRVEEAKRALAELQKKSGPPPGLPSGLRPVGPPSRVPMAPPMPVAPPTSPPSPPAPAPHAPAPPKPPGAPKAP